MTGRRVSREPFKPRRDRREVIVAVGAAVLIVLFTVVAVWILAPNDESTPTFDTPTPTVTIPSTSTPASTEPPVTTVAPTGG